MRCHELLLAQVAVGCACAMDMLQSALQRAQSRALKERKGVSTGITNSQTEINLGRAAGRNLTMTLIFLLAVNQMSFSVNCVIFKQI
jgi:hypothetical protein